MAAWSKCRGDLLAAAEASALQQRLHLCDSVLLRGHPCQKRARRQSNRKGVVLMEQWLRLLGATASLRLRITRRDSSPGVSWLPAVPLASAELAEREMVMCYCKGLLSQRPPVSRFSPESPPPLQGVFPTAAPRRSRGRKT